MSRREKLQKMLEKSPEDVFLNFGLAMELVREGAVDAAVAQFDRVAQLDPTYIPAYLHKGHVLLDAGRADEARSALLAGIDAAQKAGDAHAESEMHDLLKALR